VPDVRDARIGSARTPVTPGLITSGTLGTSGTVDSPGPLASLALLLFVFAALAASGIGRAGYSIDEEYTLFGVRGIAAHGVPILPSGALYDRGLPYTYAAWLSGVLFGHGFPAYRLPSLLSALVAIVLAFRLARMAQDSAGVALIAAAAVSAMPWTIFSAQWARFYAMFIAAMLASALLFLRYLRTGRGLWWWLGSIWLAHLLHEFALLLTLLPVIVWMLAAEKKPLSFPYRSTVFAGGAFLAGELTVLLLHFTVSGLPFRTLHDYAALHALPVGWEAIDRPGADRAYPLFDPERWSQIAGLLPLAVGGMVVGALVARRLRVSPLVATTQGALAALGQFARVWLIGVLWMFSRPRALVRTLLWTVVAVVLGALVVTLQSTRMPGVILSWPLVSGIVTFAFREATSTLTALLSEYPGSVVWLAAAATIAAWRHRSRSKGTIRRLILWTLWWLLVFDVLRVDFKPRYYSPFWVLLAIAVIPAVRCVPASWFGRRRAAAAARLGAALVVAATIAGEQYGSVDENRSSACLAGDGLCVPQMLAYDTSGVGAMRDRLRDADTVVCADELLCDLELGRTDYWLYSGTIFRHATPTGAVGLYGGAPIVSSLADLQALLLRDPSRRFWIVLPALRKYESWSTDEIVAAVPEPLRNRIQVTRTAGATVVEIGGS
jgi:hypothetical protein